MVMPSPTMGPHCGSRTTPDAYGAFLVSNQHSFPAPFSVTQATPAASIARPHGPDAMVQSAGSAVSALIFAVTPSTRTTCPDGDATHGSEAPLAPLARPT